MANIQALDPEYVTLKLLQYAEDTWDWNHFGEYMNRLDMRPGISYDVPGLGKVTIVDFHDYDPDKSYDGWSEDIWIVFEIHGVMYRAKGTYSSYQSGQWEDCVKMVRPKIKHIIEFEEA